MKYIKLFKDSLESISVLDDNTAGVLFKAIIDYSNDKDIKLDGALNALFIQYKIQLDRAKSDYEAVCERNKANGSKGGRKKPTRTQSVKVEPKQSQDKDKDKEENKLKEERFEKIWKYYNIATQAKGVKANAKKVFLSKIHKHSGEDIKKVIDAELKKQYGQRHLVTIFNNFEASLEVADDILTEGDIVVKDPIKIGYLYKKKPTGEIPKGYRIKPIADEMGNTDGYKVVKKDIV